MTFSAEVNSAEITWQEYIDFELISGSIQQESAATEPFEKHVRIYFDFTNMTEDRRITGVEFKARIYDQFGDIAHETNKIRKNYDISPGEMSGPLEKFHYYNHDEAAYNSLEPLFEIGIPNAEVAVTRVAFANYDPVEFDELEWVIPASLRDLDWAAALYSEDELKDNYYLDNVNISTEVWRVAYSAFEQSEGEWLYINIYDQHGEKIISKDIALEPFVDVGEVIINQKGVFSIEVIQDGDFEYSIFINERAN